MLTAIWFLHEHILKRIIPYYKFKAEALEAARYFVEWFQHRMAQEQLNTNDMVSINWDTERQAIKCDINGFGAIKIERKNGEIYLIIQDGSTRVRMQKDTFVMLCSYKESIEYLMSFLEANAYTAHHQQNQLKANRL